MLARARYLATWRHIVAEAPWFQERDRYPWTLPDYTGDPRAEYPCPNAIAVTDASVNIPLHENYTEVEAADIAAALLKVERAALRA